MRRALILVVLAVPGVGRAGGLSTHGRGTVLEASYHVDVEVRGLFATVETRQRLLGVGADHALAVYTFDLPGDAAVTGFEIAIGDRPDQPGVITTDAGAIGEPSTAIGDDLGVLAQIATGRPARAGDPGAPATYRYTAYPVGAAGATVTVRWIMPVRLEQGRVVLALPPRHGADLAAPEGSIRFASIAGLTAPRAVRVGGAVIANAPGAKPTAWTLAAATPIVIEAEVGTRADRPVLVADAVAIGKGRGAVAAAIIAPSAGAVTTAAADRVVFVIDASRSMRRIDRGAVVAAIGTLAAAAPATAKLEAIGFDRTPRRVLGTWRDNDAVARTALAEAVTRLGDANGSDLAAALAEAVRVVEPGHRARIVVISDGGIDLGVDADAMIAALGDRADDVEISSLVVVPSGRLAPGHGVAVLSELARRVGGRVRIARADELADRAARLSADLGPGAAWSNPTIAGTTLAFPAAIAPGDGATAIGWYHGKRPRLALAIEHAGTSVTIAAAKGRLAADALALARPTAAIELADPGRDRVARAASSDEVDAILGDPAAELAPADRAAWAAAVRARGVVAAASIALVVDTTTRLGRDRRGLIARGAPFARLPSPPERDAPLDGPDLDELAPRVAIATAVPLAGGTLDADAIKTILTLELLGRLRGCYQQALPRDPSLRGRVTFDLLMGDGEVIAAHALGARDTRFRACLVEAAHQITVPQVADPTLIRVRYPVDFSVAADKPYVVLGDADSAEPIDPSLLPAVSDPIDLTDADDPLGGIRR